MTDATVMLRSRPRSELQYEETKEEGQQKRSKEKYTFGFLTFISSESLLAGN
jgi:hypothetical protein